MEQSEKTASPVEQLDLVLPLPPSINHQYATVQGRRVLSRTGREFKALVAEEVSNWLEHHPLVDVTQFQRHYLALTITFYFKSVLRRDLDGGLKIAQDALCEALGVNDNLVVEIRLSKRVDRQYPRIAMHLTALAPGSVTLEEAGETCSISRIPEPRSGKRRRRRTPRSLEELAARHRWE
ncbi:MAG: RusA family crossover junction endodeoxyribonuclease [Candidatus Tectomicrobia bacterium]|uniref:RusA family crossover junction endodeoxyribonuclease n=1 Tax=Tectimicrobiota bacterium TaxID=2528274 RepID=A0A937W188_UNCTE|nr:RusA family crossover junction endodeoxyribonuclease [Candidatus Tectomicrobia bacterium]